MRELVHGSFRAKLSGNARNWLSPIAFLPAYQNNLIALPSKRDPEVGFARTILEPIFQEDNFIRRMSATIQEEPLLSWTLKKRRHHSVRASKEVHAEAKRISIAARARIQRRARTVGSISFVPGTLHLVPISVFVWITVYLGLARLYHLDVLWSVLLAIPLGIVAGDFVSGIVHWFADTYFTEDTPIIGRSLVKPFRLHHIYPRDICTHNLVEVAGNVCILAVPMLSICLYLLWLLPESRWLAFKVVFISVVAITTVATNQFHKWAHEEDPSPLARWLQRTRLVLNPSHHQRHHTAPFNHALLHHERLAKSIPEQDQVLPPHRGFPGLVRN